MRVRIQTAIFMGLVLISCANTAELQQSSVVTGTESKTTQVVTAIDYQNSPAEYLIKVKTETITPAKIISVYSPYSITIKKITRKGYLLVFENDPGIELLEKMTGQSDQIMYIQRNRKYQKFR